MVRVWLAPVGPPPPLMTAARIAGAPRDRPSEMPLARLSAAFGVAGRGLDNHETCGALHSNLRPVRLAMLRERGCPVGRAARPRE